MATSDLTNITAVKAWLIGNVVTTTIDLVLAQTITSVSRAIYSMMERPSILPKAYTEVVNGNGVSNSLFLRNFPVISFNSMAMDGVAVSAAPALPAPGSFGYGWVLETLDPTPPSGPSRLFLRNGRFCRGIQNISVTYSAGYQVSGEVQSVPSGQPWQITANQPFGAWAVDAGVIYANGTALKLVPGAPTQGQYAVSLGVYTFAQADAGALVNLNYGFIPADLAQAAIEWTVYRYKTRESVGQKSKSLAGQGTVSFDTSAAPEFVQRAIQPYRRVLL